MPVTISAERRQAVRAKRILSIQFRLIKSAAKNKGGNTQWHISTTHDMSASGISFLSDVTYQLSDILELQMVMSGIIDIYKGYGKVVRMEGNETPGIYLIAVKFVEEKDFIKTKKRSRTKAPS